MKLLEILYSELTLVISKGIFGISLLNFFFIILLFLVSFIIRGFFANLILSKIKKFIKKTGNTIDDSLFDALIPPLKLLPIVIIFLLFTLNIDISSTLGLYFQKINNTLSTIFVFWLIHQAIIPFTNFFYKLEKILSKALVHWILKSLKYLVIFLGSVAVLEIWGIKIGPIIAGLGLFGVAVALGAQDLFKNLISGIMILLEKRFHIGDVISVPGHAEGTVELIGFRSTLIRKFDSTPITIPNHIFAEAPILNFSNRTNRRIYWIIGLEYNSSLEQIKKFTKIIYDYIKDSDDFIVNEQFKHFVKLDKFNDSSVDFLICCFTSTNEWDIYLEIKERLAMFVKKEVDACGLSFAFPTRSIYIEKKDDQSQS